MTERLADEVARAFEEQLRLFFERVFFVKLWKVLRSSFFLAFFFEKEKREKGEEEKLARCSRPPLL